MKDNTTFIIVIFFCGCVPEVIVPSCTVGFLYIPKKLGFVYFVAVQPCDVRIYIRARWLYSCVCTLNYLVIIIMQTYLEVLNF